MVLTVLTTQTSWAYASVDVCYGVSPRLVARSSLKAVDEYALSYYPTAITDEIINRCYQSSVMVLAVAKGS